MKAPVLHRVREPMAVEDVDLDAPKEGEVHVRLVASGICHSCLHAADGSWGETMTPMVLGDEGAGIVAGVGAGATHTFNLAQENVVEAIKRVTGRGADYAVVAVGSTKAAQQAWDSLAPGGTCVVIGLAPAGERISIDPFTMIGYGNERRLIGSRYGSARVFDDFPRLVDLYLAGKLQLDQLITKRYSVDEINEAHRALAAGENARGLLVF